MNARLAGVVIGVAAVAWLVTGCGSEESQAAEEQKPDTETSAPALDPALTKFPANTAAMWEEMCATPTLNTNNLNAVEISADGTSVTFGAYFSTDLVDANGAGTVLLYGDAACILDLYGVYADAGSEIFSAGPGASGVTVGDGYNTTWEIGPGWRNKITVTTAG